MLKEERRQYRNSLRKEHEADLMSIQRQPKDTLEDKIAYEQLKALNHYNKPAGNFLLSFSCLAIDTVGQKIQAVQAKNLVK